ncbi:MAG: 50S ribosomal protein L18 [Patescibacteria group bacterium]|nr:50S ribosomal protein L18 [Patescibacteria group bacterium]
MDKKMEKRIRLKKKIRTRIKGTAERPRLSVFRSNNSIYAQLIDDVKEKTIVSSSDLNVKKGTKTEKAKEVGKELAKKAIEKKIKQVVFDRSGFKYIGRIKALADAAREGGLEF